MGIGRPRTLELTGEVFNNVKVLNRNADDRRYWDCLCPCGTVFRTTPQRLREGRCRSCGCMKADFMRERFTTHGAAGNGRNSGEYQSYTAMIHRCYDDKRNSWDRYGGRGIIVAEESWLEESPNGFLNFLRDMGERPADTSLDRINSNGNYSKDNCRWANRRTQGYNQTVTKTSRNTSKYRGVSHYGERNKPWAARIGNGKGGYEWLGQHLTEDEAALAYNKRAIEIWGDEAILNIIEGEQNENQ